MALAPVTDKQKQLFQLMNQGKAFVNPLIPGSSGLTSSISQSAGHVSTLTTNLNNATYKTQLANAGLTPSVLTSMTTGAAAGSAAVTTLRNYGDKSIAETSQRLRVAEQYNTVSKRFTGVDPGCSSHNGVMGVVKSLGQTAMDGYNSVVASANTAMKAVNDAIAKGVADVTALAQKAVTAVNAAVAKATEFANKVTQMIADEVAELARQVAASTHAWLAGVLPDWFGDECKGQVLDKVSTPELKSASTTA